MHDIRCHITSSCSETMEIATFNELTFEREQEHGALCFHEAWFFDKYVFLPCSSFLRRLCCQFCLPRFLRLLLSALLAVRTRIGYDIDRSWDFIRFELPAERSNRVLTDERAVAENGGRPPIRELLVQNLLLLDGRNFVLAGRQS